MSRTTERRREAAAAGKCRDLCGRVMPPGSRYKRCRPCREKNSARSRRYLSTPNGARKHLANTRLHRRLRVEAGLCVVHGGERPCLLCSQDMVARREANPKRRKLTCSACGGDHRCDSFLCPERFRVDIMPYATSRPGASL